ncbi:MAG: TIGR02996 domain-containing protein [Fimbriiglobus sp.]
MTDHDALLGNILRDPDSDLPRLVYADFLEDTGDEALVARAEFIRKQIASVRDELNEQALVDFRIREKILLGKYGKDWLAPLRVKGEALQNIGTHGIFERGFVERVWMPAAIFITKGAKLFTKAPVIELRVTRTKLPELEELLALPETAKLRAFDLCDRSLGDGTAELIAQSEVLTNFRQLRLKACGIHDRGAEAFLHTPNHWKPQLLDFEKNPITTPMLTRLRARFGDTVVLGTENSEPTA